MFFVVGSGSIEVRQPGDDGEVTLRVMGAGEFTGEVSMLSGRRSLVTLRMGESGEVIEVERDELLELVQTDAEQNKSRDSARELDAARWDPCEHYAFAVRISLDDLVRNPA